MRPMTTLRTFFGFVLIGMCGAPTAAQDITRKDLLSGLADPTRWLSVYGDYTGQHYSPLTQITAVNASALRPRWTLQTDLIGQFETTPLVIDGILYVTGVLNNAWAVDGRTGRRLWSYSRTLPQGLKACCGPVNRGFAVYRDRLYMSTLDAHLVALDMKTGTVVWDVEVVDFKLGYASTSAPLIVNDRVIVGIAGGEYASRGFLDAYDATNGNRAWRFWTVPAKGEPGSETWPERVLERGGAATWMTGTFDPELNVVYWGTGNPNPAWDGDSRPGDNLYSASLLALNADSGTLRWHYQFTPHDTHDWDSNQVPVLADLTIAGQLRKVVMHANRNGFFYVLDRESGALIHAKPYVHLDWAKEIGADGRPVLVPGHDPTVAGTVTCPDWNGGTNHMAPAFDRSTSTFFVTVRETCGRFFRHPTFEASLGDRTNGGDVTPLDDPPRWGALRAIDALTGEKKWDVKYDRPGWAGVTATAGGVVFSADHQGTFMAVDASNGKVLYTYQTGGPTYASSITYMIDGTQYVLLPSGSMLTAFALR